MLFRSLIDQFLANFHTLRAPLARLPQYLIVSLIFTRLHSGIERKKSMCFLRVCFHPLSYAFPEARNLSCCYLNRPRINRIVRTQDCSGLAATVAVAIVATCPIPNSLTAGTLTRFSGFSLKPAHTLNHFVCCSNLSDQTLLKSPKRYTCGSSSARKGRFNAAFLHNRYIEQSAHRGPTKICCFGCAFACFQKKRITVQ